VEYLGADKLIYGEVLDQGHETAIISRMSSEQTFWLEPGEVYDFAVQKQQLRFFDSETGERVAPVKT
jgi:multiple sugar transport system ATP-binding protein